MRDSTLPDMTWTSFGVASILPDAYRKHARSLLHRAQFDRSCLENVTNMRPFSAFAKSRPLQEDHVGVQRSRGWNPLSACLHVPAADTFSPSCVTACDQASKGSRVFLGHRRDPLPLFTRRNVTAVLTNEHCR